MSFILGYKDNQTQTFDTSGNRIPVTKIITSPCYLVNIKTKETDGYTAIQLGFGLAKKIAKPTNGILKKAGIKNPLRFLKEVRIPEGYEGIKIVEESPETEGEAPSESEGKRKFLQIGEEKIGIGDEVKASVFFKEGDSIDIAGTSKGKGFQGVMKRHGFGGGPKTHGQSDRARAPGSIGPGTTPGRVYKGTRMAGQMGNKRITVKNLTVVQADDQSLTVKGVIPGSRGGFIEVTAHEL